MPRVRPWLKALRAELARLPAAETTVLTHSLGGLLWLHWASTHPAVQVARVLLVAPSQPDEDQPESLGFRPGKVFAFAAGLSEFAGGLLTAVGLLGPFGPALMIATMTVAIIAVHLEHGFFNSSNGYELPLLYASGAAAIALIGPGAYSLDRWFGLQWLSTPTIAWTATVLAVVVGWLNLAARRTSPPIPAVG